MIDELGRPILLDLSVWQGKNINWALMAQKVSGVIIKGSQWTKDPRLDENWKGAGDYGIPRGVYHFWEPGLTPAVQANIFSSLGVIGELPPALDLEKPPVSAWQVEQFLKIYKSLTGIDVRLMYSTKSFWDLYILQNRFNNIPAWVNNTDTWVAQWTSAPVPDIPHGFPTWTIWQHTAYEPALPYGVTGSKVVDKNRFNGTVAEYEAWIKKPIQQQPLVSTAIVSVPVLRVRSSPWGNVVSSKRMGEQLVILDAVNADSDNSLWYVIGADKFVAAWLCTPITKN